MSDPRPFSVEAGELAERLRALNARLAELRGRL
jgi:hypothetical protein